MRVLGEFRLKTLLDRIVEELRQVSKESHQSSEHEYNLKNPVCEQQEVQEFNKDTNAYKD